MPKLISIYLSLVLVLIATKGFAQDEDKDTLGSETVVVIKPYTPSINDAFKARAVPVLNDSITLQKKPISYRIFSVPVASTFTPTKGRAAKVEKAKPITVYDNYATLGAGNFTSALAEFYSNFEIDRGQNLGLKLKHNSAQGGIDEVELDDKYYDTALNLDFSSYDRDLRYTLGFEALHQLYNWYGLPQTTSLSQENIESIDPQQHYFGVGVSGTINLDDAIFNKAQGELFYFGDSYGTTEFNAMIQPQFEFDLAGEPITLIASANYLNTSFDQAYRDSEQQAFSYANFGLSPSIAIRRDNLSLDLGASVFYNIDVENSDSNIFVYPQIKASLRVVDEFFIAYAGLNGALKQNTYKTFVAQNPFLSPTQQLRPTDEQYVAKLGIKGKLSELVNYNLRGSYSNAENQPLFKANDIVFLLSSRENYQHGNSFSVVYDNVSTLSFFGELTVDVSQHFRLALNGEFFSYDTEFEDEAWNLPELKATLLSDVKLTEKLTANAQLFFVGEREDQQLQFNTTTNSITSSTNSTLDAYFDANLRLSYQLNEQLSFFVKGNNLIGNNYERWLNFPVYGIQGLAGATYKFDW